jgi:predicted pyridoxine 5'-phosphate oxidase superfamily flavin-nucleotide-binding protein
LRAIYKAPNERATQKELTHIDPHLQRFISLSPFLVISSGAAFSSALLDRVPEEAKNKACICSKCASPSEQGT